jgi:predicted RNase H-like HicB family nuclease
VNKYSFNIIWSDEDGEYVATCPAFPGLSALGETEEEALAEAKVALGLFIKTAEERAIPLPEPEAIQKYSGQFRVRLPKSLHSQAVRLAALDDVSLNQYVVCAIEQKVTGDMHIAEMKRILADQASQYKVALASALSSDERLTIQSRVLEATSVTEKTEKIVIGRQGRSN